jgi:hypothetical protein
MGRARIFQLLISRGLRGLIFRSIRYGALRAPTRADEKSAAPGDFII